MIVVDASAVVDLVLADEAGERIAGMLTEHAELFAPAHLPVEIASALWRQVRTAQLDPAAGDQAINLAATVPITLMDTDALLGPAWRLRQAVRIADAFYVACAQSLSMPLLTTDARLARAAEGLGVATL